MNGYNCHFNNTGISVSDQGTAPPAQSLPVVILLEQDGINETHNVLLVRKYPDGISMPLHCLVVTCQWVRVV